MVMTTETIQKAQDIIMKGLDTQFRGKVCFDSVDITPRPGPDDEEYLDVLVIYQSEDGNLAAPLLNSLYENIGVDLRAIGIDSIPSISYRDRTENSEWSNLVQVRHFGQV